MVCSCKTEMVLLGGRLKNGRFDKGQVYACPKCDGPDIPVESNTKSIIDISKENHEQSH